MLRLRHLSLGAIVLLLTCLTSVPQTQDNIVGLSATQSYMVLASANTPSTLINFQVDVEGRDSEVFDVISASPGAIVTLILPNGTEINSSNAAAFGYIYGVEAEDSEAITDRLLITFMSLSGTHTIIQLPSTAPSGTYQIKINTVGVITDTEIAASYITGSRIRVALATRESTYNVGQSVVLSALVFNGSTPVTNATVVASVMDMGHPDN